MELYVGIFCNATAQFPGSCISGEKPISRVVGLPETVTSKTYFWSSVSLNLFSDLFIHLKEKDNFNELRLSDFHLAQVS